MKKLLFAVFLALAVSALFADSAASTSITVKPDPTARWTNVLGLDFPTYGVVTRNAAGQIIGVSGFNFGLGYSQKNYNKPLETNIFNGYWGWGTMGLIVPYVDFGADYVMDSGFYFGGMIGLLLIIPIASIEIGAYF